MNHFLNKLVRAYLQHFPITEGKSKLLQATKGYIRPENSIEESPTKYGFSLRLNLNNPEQERIYFFGEHDERYEIACLLKLINAGMVCWDIGANIGFYTCLFSSLVGQDGKVVSFEPLSTTRETLAGNVALNGMINVEIVPVAVGADDKEARIYFHDAQLGEGTASIYQTDEKVCSEAISIVRLDTISGALPAPNFIKIDVEGAQEDVWRGGESFFSVNAPLVMAELLESTDIQKLHTLQSRIRAHNYRIFEMLKGGYVRETQDFSKSRKRNFLLAKPETEAIKRIECLIA
jgi:FkbM family methyltransferase